MRPVFCFSFAQDAVPKASCAAPETGRANHAAASVWKKENGMEEFGGSSEVLQEPPQLWLDLTNLAVTKEYHSLSRLSTPDFRFFQKICCAAAPLPISTFRFGMEQNFQQNGLAFLPNCCYYKYKAAGADALRPHLTAHRTPRKAAFCGFL